MGQFFYYMYWRISKASEICTIEVIIHISSPLTWPKIIHLDYHHHPRHLHLISLFLHPPSPYDQQISFPFCVPSTSVSSIHTSLHFRLQTGSKQTSVISLPTSMFFQRCEDQLKTNWPFSLLSLGFQVTAPFRQFPRRRPAIQIRPASPCRLSSQRLYPSRQSTMANPLFSFLFPYQAKT